MCIGGEGGVEAGILRRVRSHLYWTKRDREGCRDKCIIGGGRERMVREKHRFD